MSRIVIVPNDLRDAINEALDVVLRDGPPDAVNDREALYGQLLLFFDEHGYVPQFSVVKT